MKILIVACIRGDGGYEEKELTESLRAEIEKLGHKVDHFYLPYVPDMLGLPEAVASMSLIDVSQAEILITVGFPACFIPHANKRSFIFSSASPLFEYWNTEFGVLERGEYFYIKNFINKAENRLGQEAKSVFCGSKLLASDLAARSGINSLVFYPGTNAPEKGSVFNSKPPFFVSETFLRPQDRIELALEAVKKSGKKFALALYIPDTLEIYMEALTRSLKEEGLESNITVFRERLSRDAIRRSAGYLALGHAVRNIPGGAAAAAEEGCPIAAFSDGGAILELAETGACVKTCDVLPEALAKIMRGSSFHDAKKTSGAVCGDIRELALMMVEK